MITIKRKIFFLILFVSVAVSAQVKTNFEIFNTLVDSSAYLISSKISKQDRKYFVEQNTINEYSPLSKRIENSLARNKISVGYDSTCDKIVYSISQASVGYSNLLKDGFLGNYLLERKIILRGEYAIKNFSNIINSDIFYYTVTDTIPYNQFNYIESGSLPFTKGKAPEAPFLPSILEPVIAVAAVVVTVVLFFSVRSK